VPHSSAETRLAEGVAPFSHRLPYGPANRSPQGRANQAPQGPADVEGFEGRQRARCRHRSALAQQQERRGPSGGGVPPPHHGCPDVPLGNIQTTPPGPAPETTSTVRGWVVSAQRGTLARARPCCPESSVTTVPALGGARERCWCPSTSPQRPRSRSRSLDAERRSEPRSDRHRPPQQGGRYQESLEVLERLYPASRG